MIKKIIIISMLSLVTSASAFGIINKSINKIQIVPIMLPINGSEDTVSEKTLLLKDGITDINEAEIYKLKTYSIQKENIKQMAQKFRINSEVEEEVELDRFIARDQKKVFWMEKLSGKWGFEDISKLYYNIGNLEDINIPDDQTALKIAEDALIKYGIDINAFDKGIVTNISEQKTPDDPEIILGKNIYFYRMFKGKPLLGVSRVIVTLGSNGEIHAIKKLYKDFETTPVKVKLKPLNKVFNEIKTGKGIVHYNGKSQKIEVSSVELEYWEGPGISNGDEYLQPVYHLKGKGIDNDSETFESYVSAVEEGQSI